MASIDYPSLTVADTGTVNTLSTSSADRIVAAIMTRFNELENRLERFEDKLEDIEDAINNSKTKKRR
jgi:archaellum component FlaC